jgi:hypothetical protein
MSQLIWFVGLLVLVAKLWSHLQYGERRGWL